MPSPLLDHSMAPDLPVAPKQAVLPATSASLDPKNHPDRLESGHVLAGVYEADGQVKEAVSLLEQVVKIQE